MNKNIKKQIKNIIAITLIISSVNFAVGCSKEEDAKETFSAKRPATDVPGEEKPQTEANEDASAQKSGSIVTLGDSALEIFNGNDSGVDKYIETISNHKKELGKDINVYNLVAPTHVEFGLPDKYKDMSNPQKPVIDKIYKEVDSQVKTVDAYSNLKKHKDEYIYFNTDHHWTSLGAYYAYEEFAKEAGFKPKNIKDYEKHTKEGFLGTLYTQTQDNNLKNNPDKVDYYKIPYDYKVYRYEKEKPNEALKTTLYADYASGTNAYSVFLHGDFPRVDIVNKKAESKKKIIVVKESYGNAFVPFLIPHYEEVIVIDSRQYKENLKDLATQKNATDVLFINNMFAVNTEKIVNTIADLN